MVAAVDEKRLQSLLGRMAAETEGWNVERLEGLLVDLYARVHARKAESDKARRRSRLA